ncbi:thioredoxin-like protein [Podospora appendiculata]|uniref:Thioredoxin-like protein n=1 Tax=Podospora appendiculata TaxID=314037 RepID=A0AAE1CHL1_9PEZI|nr:thioredoxin-like protein [Podospora appendiculata]
MFFRKTLDIVTLFHKAGSPASQRVATLLKQASAAASSTATEDQASDSAAQTTQRPEFDLNITEEAPTTDQLQTILEYVGPKGIPSIIQGAETEVDALRKFKQSHDTFQRPVVVDWSNGKAIAGDNESAILTLLNALPKK